MEVRYSIDGGATFSSPVSDGGSGSINTPISGTGLTLTADSSDFVAPNVTKLVLGVSGVTTTNSAFTLVVQASVDFIDTAPPPQTLSFKFTGSTAGSGDSATMETWVDQSNQEFGGALGGPAGANVISDTNPVPIDLAGGTTSTGSVTFSGTTPYSLTTQLETTVSANDGISFNNSNTIRASSQNVPSINTSQQPALAFVGESIADTATVTNLVNPQSGDTVTFKLYNNSSASGTPLFTDTEQVTISGSTATATSAGYTAAATGTDYWVATFNGDSNNAAVTSLPTNEPVNIDTINTSQTPAIAFVGQTISDTATVTGLVSPNSNDTVTFNLYNNANGTGTPLFADTEKVTINGSTATVTSSGYTPTGVGTVYWVATFNGDTNNAKVTSGSTAEQVNVDTINTQQQPANASVGSSIADTATVTGLVSPSSSDTVTFNLYSSATVQNSSTLFFTDTETVSISGSTATATSKGYMAMATGTDYWVATFNGDSNNAAVNSGATAEPVSITTTTSPLGSGQAATLGFWKNAGQAVILNFGPTPTSLGTWLETNFPNLFKGFSGQNNAYVANQFKTGGTSNTYQQAFAVALDIYATTTSLGGASVISGGFTTKYGFKVSDAGDLNATWNVGRAAPAFDIPSGGSTVLTLYQILKIADSHYNSGTGQFYGGDPTLTDELNTTLNNINSKADIK
jgi:hypothetical protein